MKRMFSGIQPSGNLHIGNYLGAVQQWVEVQKDYDTTVCIVDLHAITVPQDPEDLRRRTVEIAKIYLAGGIDPEQATIFVQSHVPQHAELGWILNTITKNGDLTKMTQFKDKSGIDFENMDENRDTTVLQAWKESFNSVGVGLFDYPVLMAADIFLYDADVVPVGDDQTQHVELARTIARRFNKRFGETFTVPNSMIRTEGARIMALDNPSKKMSKSALSSLNYIALSDTPDDARRKIMKAVTDSGSEIVYREDKPALHNLINIYSLLSGKKTQDIEAMYAGKGYADFKHGLGEVVALFLEDFQDRYHALSDGEVLKILAAGGVRARDRAEETMKRVRERVGFLVI